ncbi:MAG: GumC family protein [Ignavibacteriales bacterium]
MSINNNNGSGYRPDADVIRFIRNDSAGLREYLQLIRIHYIPVLLISLTLLAVSVLAALKMPDIYKSSTMLKLSKPKGNILSAPLVSEMTNSTDPFMENEIEILKSLTIRKKVTKALLDSLNLYPEGKFNLIFNHDSLIENRVLLPVHSIVKKLGEVVSVEQKASLEIINISAESPSPWEAAMIANIYAKVYQDMNLTFNRLQMINVREFLEKQAREKRMRLIESEDVLRNYQVKGGIISLPNQSKALIDQLTDFESRRNAARIELVMVTRNLADFKQELARQEPRITDYLEKYAIEPYLQELQKGIAQYEIKKDYALSAGNESANSELIKSYNNKIAELKDKRDQKLQVFKAGMLAFSSEEVKKLLQQVLELEVKYHALTASYAELNSIVRNYESRFNALPRRTIDLARLEREKGELEKIYILIQEKYQEALINEQSTPGNVLIIDPASPPLKPYKPNRILIIVIGLVLGTGFGVGFVVVRNYFDNKVHTPEDIQKMNINIIGWVPHIDYLNRRNDSKEFEFIVAKKPNSVHSEAYRAIRTRIQFSRLAGNGIQTILLTSGSPHEGKTITSLNLAGSFAMTGRRTLLLDCDMRKPRLHKVFRQLKTPGLTDYIYRKVCYEKLFRKTEISNLLYVPSGTIPVNPAEILGSQEMMNLLNNLKRDFDTIIIDSPPILAVTDAEILASIADVSILIAAADSTEVEVLKKSVDLLKQNNDTFIGVLLNNFVYKNGYGSYYRNNNYYIN